MSGARRLFVPRPVSVRVDRGGRPCALGAVAVEVIREDWVVGPIDWADGRAVRRRYYELVLADGASVTVFCDLAGGRWYRH
jgi:hypothetical protein